MGFWSGIKYALNSTLGTEGFKPLDKIIEGQRTLAASDSIIGVLLSSPKAGGTSYDHVVGEFVPKTNGNIRLIGEYNNTINSEKNFILNIYKNSYLHKSYTTSISKATSPFVFNYDFTIEKNAQYRVEVELSGSTSYLNYLKIGANIVDTSLVEVV